MRLRARRDERARARATTSRRAPTTPSSRRSRRRAASSSQVELLPPSAPPTNVDCASATPIDPGVAATVSIVDPLPTNLPTACPPSTGELTYSFTLTQPQDVRVYASTHARQRRRPSSACARRRCTGADRRAECEANASRRHLSSETCRPGRTSSPSGHLAHRRDARRRDRARRRCPPPDQTCAVAARHHAQRALRLSTSRTTRTPSRTAASPAAPTRRTTCRCRPPPTCCSSTAIPQTESGGVSLDTPACDRRRAARLRRRRHAGCALGKRNVPAGDYRVVVADQLGLQGTLTRWSADTVAPTIVPPGRRGQTCATAVDASSGGFFTGDTSTVGTATTEPAATRRASPGGAHRPGALAEPRRSRSASCSTWRARRTRRSSTSGRAPPARATPVDNGCYVGFGPQRSFLDLELTPGQYWILVTGYNGAKGRLGPRRARLAAVMAVITA